jgi:hypothetical protein
MWANAYVVKNRITGCLYQEEKKAFDLSISVFAYFIIIFISIQNWLMNMPG